MKLCSDLHLSLKPPIIRSAEEDWLGVQRGYLDQLREAGDSPIVICAGDIFDKWDSSAELINFALAHLPNMYAIPGQHDLPLHSYKDIGKSAFWTLVQAGRITEIRPGKPVDVVGALPLRLHGFPFGCELKPNRSHHDLVMDVAVVHRYIWKKDKHPNATMAQHVSSLAKSLEGYDMAVFGDNHISFSCKVGKCLVWNCGGFFRRKSDEFHYKPSIGLLSRDGTVRRHFLDISRDKFLERETPIGKELDAEAFLSELESLGDTAINFKEAIHRYLDSHVVENEVKKIVLSVVS